MPKTIESKEELASRFARYSNDQSQFERAIEAALGGCVKRHVFLPSGRYVYTVVGSNADEFIDPDKPFCSCESYFYGVLSDEGQVLLPHPELQDSGRVRPDSGGPV